ncbi:MAG TPA: DUF2782 domain-containing protein [Dokdonella sp.]|nr:DUF2782 domain-containing protein [Dokdonella sp.]
MKPIAVFATVLIAAATASAAGADRKPPRSDVPPPPGMNEPGVTTAPQPAAAEEPAAAAPTQADDPLAPLPKPDARLVRDKASRDKAATDDRIARSEVTKRKQGDDTVEEYRQNGRIWMIKIIPITGPSQTFMTNDGSGRLVRDPKEGPVSPVYYSLYEWK